MKMTVDAVCHNFSRLTWHAAFAAATMVCALAATPRLSSACSVAEMRRPMALGRDGSLVYARSPTDPDRPGVHTIEWFDRDGIPTTVHEIDVGAPWGLKIVALEGDGSVWLHTPCSALAMEERCGRLIKLQRDGRRSHEVGLGMNQIVTRRGDGSFMTRRHGEAAVSVLDLETGEPTTTGTGVSLGTEPLPSKAGTIRMADPGGGWLTTRNTEEEVILRRFDSQGIQTAERRYPIARADRRAGATAETRLGPFYRLIIDSAGFVLAPQYSLDEFCVPYQPGSVAIFDRNLQLLGVAQTAGRVRQARVRERELETLTIEGAVQRFRLDGRAMSEPWWPPGRKIRKSISLRSSEEIYAALESLSPDDPIDWWTRLYGFADDGQQVRIASWLVEAGPAAFDSLYDALWMELAEPLCAAHPLTAPAEALRRFSRSIGDQRVQWLSVLPDCFERAPDGALELAAHVLRLPKSARRFHGAAHGAYAAWGYPPDLLDELWADALGDPPDYRSIGRLLVAFEQLEEAFRARLGSADQRVRRRVFEMLLKTMSDWHEYEYGEREARQVPRVLPALLRAADGWVRGAAAELATLGRLLRLAHGAEGAGAELTALLTASQEVPLLFRDIALALRCAYPDTAPTWSSPEDRSAWETFLARAPRIRDVPAQRGSLMRYDDAWRWVDARLASASVPLEEDAP